MKITIITVTWNSAATIAGTLQSVLAQTYADWELVIVDGNSKDDTLAVVRAYEPLFAGKMKWISEPDRGIYDAMNKGIAMASGEFIGILNSDDYFSGANVLQQIADGIKESEADLVYGDVCFVAPHNQDKVIRYYSARWFKPFLFRFGFMPPHPGVYIRRKYFGELGSYKTDFRIASDYELLIRYLYVHRLRPKYLDICVVNMLPGGISTKSWRSRLLLNREIVRACRENGIYTNLLILSMKYLFKLSGVLFPNRKKR